MFYAELLGHIGTCNLTFDGRKFKNIELRDGCILADGRVIADFGSSVKFRKSETNPSVDEHGVVQVRLSCDPYRQEELKLTEQLFSANDSTGSSQNATFTLHCEACEQSIFEAGKGIRCFRAMPSDSWMEVVGHISCHKELDKIFYKELVLHTGVCLASETELQPCDLDVNWGTLVCAKTANILGVSDLSCARCKLLLGCAKHGFNDNGTKYPKSPRFLASRVNLKREALGTQLRDVRFQMVDRAWFGLSSLLQRATATSSQKFVVQAVEPSCHANHSKPESNNLLLWFASTRVKLCFGSFDNRNHNPLARSGVKIYFLVASENDEGKELLEKWSKDLVVETIQLPLEIIQAFLFRLEENAKIIPPGNRQGPHNMRASCMYTEPNEQPFE
eukprot:m.84695 g.84695  ORF g.84695 m.84695 type:complete len:390 (+) comp12976_c0_seq3:28-1197(+)